MDLQITFTEQPASQDVLQVGKLLGEGKFQVYSAYSQKNKTKYALKVFPQDSIADVHYKKDKVISHFKHQNIIRNIPITVVTDEFHFLLTEYAPFGDFLQLTMNKAFQSEAMIRTYFHQLIAGIEYLHSQGVAHLDLKLENLVLGSDYKLKIIDFDQAQSIRDTKLACKGSPDYRAPEVIDRRCKNLSAVDIYSAGIILYTLIAGEFPFKETTDSKGVRLQHYSTFMKDKTKFWEMKAARQQDKSLFSEELIELLNEMLEFDSTKRIKLEDIKQSKWYQGPVIAEERLSLSMKTILSSLSIKEKQSKIAPEAQDAKKN